MRLEPHRPTFCSRVMTPSAVPRRRGATIRVVAGQIIAGTSEKLTPISTVEAHGVRSVRLKTMKVIGSSSVPTVSIMARRPKRSARSPNSGVANTAAANTPEFTLPACCSVRPLTCCRYSIAYVCRNGKKTAAYSTCRPRMYQYDRSNVQIPRQLICPDSIGRADIGGACAETSRRNMTAATRPTPLIAAPSHKGGCQPASYRDRAQEGEVSSENDPTRARERNIAVARAMPLRENQRATPATREMNIAPSLTRAEATGSGHHRHPCWRQYRSPGGPSCQPGRHRPEHPSKMHSPYGATSTQEQSHGVYTGRSQRFIHAGSNR